MGVLPLDVRHLPKHLRPRYRYAAVEVETWPDADFDLQDLQRSVWFSAQNLLGDPGSADVDLRMVDGTLWRGGGEVLFRVRRSELDRARAAIACVEAVFDDPVRLRIRGVSGTIRAAEEKYIRGPPEEPREEQVVFRNDSRAAVLWDGRADVSLDGSFVGATPFDLE